MLLLHADWEGVLIPQMARTPEVWHLWLNYANHELLLYSPHKSETTIAQFLLSREQPYYNDVRILIESFPTARIQLHWQLTRPNGGKDNPMNQRKMPNQTMARKKAINKKNSKASKEGRQPEGKMTTSPRD